MNRYLSGNILAWLQDEQNPEIRYLTMRDILPERYKPGELQKSRETLLKSKWIAKLLAVPGTGIMGDAAHFDIFYRGSMWYFAEAVMRGLDRREAPVERTAEFLFERCQKASGGFILNWKPEVEVSCRTGDMLAYLACAGYDDGRIRKGIDWLLTHQRADGGWLHCPVSGPRDIISLLMFKKSGGGLQRDADPAVRSCVFASAACLRALVRYNELHAEFQEPIRRAAEFFLARRLFVKTREEDIPACLGNYREGDFTRPGYPVMSQYDVLFGLKTLARAGYSADARTVDAFNLVVSRQNGDGSWSLENTGTGMLCGGKPLEESPGTPSKWVTLNALRFFRYAGLIEPPEPGSSAVTL